MNGRFVRSEGEVEEGEQQQHKAACQWNQHDTRVELRMPMSFVRLMRYYSISDVMDVDVEG